MKKGTSCTFFSKFFTAIPSRTKNEHIRILRWPLPSFCCASYIVLAQIINIYEDVTGEKVESKEGADK